MSITLRPATQLDAYDLWVWKNDPTMRKFSIKTHDEIGLFDHIKWLEKHLHEIQIIEVDGKKAGDIRIEGDEVAIKLDPKYRGMGIGKQALWAIQGNHHHLIAKIVDGNEASMALFTGLGFKVIDHKDNYSILEWNY